MVRRAVGAVAAASALTANAFLVPFQSAPSEDVSAQLINTQWSTVMLPCPECVLPSGKSKGDDIFSITGGANSLLVNVSTILGGKAIGLTNPVGVDHVIHPVLDQYANAVVDMVRSDTDMVAYVSQQANTMSCSVTSHHLQAASEDAGPDRKEQIVHITYQIDCINKQPVTVDPIIITAIKNEDGDYMLVAVETEAAESGMEHPLPPHPEEPDHEHRPHGKPPHHHHKDGEKEHHHHDKEKHHKGKHHKGKHHKGPHHKGPHHKGKDHKDRPHKGPKPPCHMPGPICKAVDFINDKVEALTTSLTRPRPCPGAKGPGRHGGPMGAHTDKDGVTHVPGHMRPPPMADGRHGRAGPPHGPHHQMMMAHMVVRRILLTLIPIVLGICVGMTVSLIGMLVGRAISFLWIHFVRGGRRGYASVQLSEEEADAVEAKEVQDGFSPNPPAYEDAPEYEEKEKSEQ